MSSFQLNLSSLTLSAKERLAHLVASAGGALCARLLSSAPGDAVGPSSGFAAISFSDALGAA